jgi:hypothetical protein
MAEKADVKIHSIELQREQLKAAVQVCLLVCGRAAVAGIGAGMGWLCVWVWACAWVWAEYGRGYGRAMGAGKLGYAHLYEHSYGRAAPAG